MRSAEAKVALFRRLFRGRTDVYPIRWESKVTGKSGYTPACAGSHNRTDFRRLPNQYLPETTPTWARSAQWSSPKHSAIQRSSRRSLTTRAAAIDRSASRSRRHSSSAGALP